MITKGTAYQATPTMGISDPIMEEFGTQITREENMVGQVITVPKPSIWDPFRFTITRTSFEPAYFDAADPRKYIHHLNRLTSSEKILYRHARYVPLPPERNIGSINQRLLNLLEPRQGDEPILFREFSGIHVYDPSLLARCVRFAQSDAQKSIDWRAHPAHVAEILQRTNVYGMELLLSRNEVVAGSWPGSKSRAPEYFYLLALRTVHSKYAQGDKRLAQCTAADIFAIVKGLPREARFSINEVFDNATDQYYSPIDYGVKQRCFEAAGISTKDVGRDYSESQLP